MENGLDSMADQAARARLGAHGDSAAHDEGQSHRSPMVGPSGFDGMNDAVHVHYNDVAEHYTHADQTWYAFSTETPSFLPPVSTEFAPLVPTDPELEDGPREMAHLPHLLASSADSPEVLEAAVEAGMRLTHRLAGCLAQHESTVPDVARFLVPLKKLQAESTPPRTVVGVVGNTGAGKSSVINALLDEDELLPTNCFRACTASPTEISYNHSDDPAALYRAEVEFITAEDWTRELACLFTELLDGNGEVSRECTNADSDAGVAYAKLKAVYPHKTKEMLASGSPRDFANEPAVRDVLGEKRRLQERSAPDLYRGLQRYVDSKEKETGAAARSSPMEFWPLVKVVRIHTKAAALSTGAVIVDLDANSGRAAVATSYMKACSGLWIVAPITRAVDDKTAKTLLGDSFKRQLKYDGTVSAVTFICSKTDDILVKEAARNFGMEDVISASNYHVERLTSNEKYLSAELGQLKTTKDANAELLGQCGGAVDTWEDLQSRLRDFHNLQRQVDWQIRARSARIEEIRSERQRLLAEVKAACIKRRNDRSREAIKEDFALGIKELDQENAVERDDATFDPDEDLRDYAKVARDLSVFCVSSRAFQNLGGKLGQDDLDGHGYMTAEDTEIPQLQEHAKKLTEDGRIKTCQRFLNKLLQLLNSISFWAFDNGSMHILPEGGKEQEIHHCRRLSYMLQNKGFHVAIRGSIASMKQAMKECIVNDFVPAISVAINSAVGTCQGWGDHTSTGGLRWQTYKATVRRNGAYKGSAGARDFNAELFEPISKHLAAGWERAFQRRIPAILSEFAAVCQEHLEDFHRGALQRPTEGFANAPKPFLLTSQINTHKHMLSDLPDRIMATVTELQREASRESVPVILAAMTEAYGECVAERGVGSFARMKSAMVRHVETSRKTMFNKAVGTVMQRFEAMCVVVTKELDATTRAITESVCYEYKTELIEAGARRQRGVSQPERELRASMRDILRGADDAFTILLPEGRASALGEGPAGPIQGPLPEPPQNDFADAQQPFGSITEARQGGFGDHDGVEQIPALASIARCAQDFMEEA